MGDNAELKRARCMPVSTRLLCTDLLFERGWVCILSGYISWGSIITINKEFCLAEEHSWKAHTGNSTVVSQLHLMLPITLYHSDSAQLQMRRYWSGGTAAQA
jgi:hypothetical protein